MSDELALLRSSIELLRCAGCGAPGAVRHRDLGAVRLAHELWLEGGESHGRIFGQGEYYDGEPLDRAGYEAAIERLARPCACGGDFRCLPPRRRDRNRANLTVRNT